MNNGTLGLSFWLAFAAGVLAFGVTWVLGDAIWWTAALYGAIVFVVLLAVLAYAFSGKSDGAKPAAASGAAPAAAPSAKAAPAAVAPAAVAPAAAAPVATAEKAPAAAPAKPAAKPAEAPVEGTVGTAPARLTAPRDGRADDLKIIEGVGPAMEKLVNSLGFYHYDQIANWSADELAWVDSHMKTFRGRIVRDRWQAQAKIILAEGVPAFLERAKTNNY
jgi:predicted flap endonuclease-1-like 5' DNA nuclease